MAIAKAISLEGWESTEDFDDVQTVEFDAALTNASLGDFLRSMAEFIAAVPDDFDDANDFLDEAAIAQQFIDFVNLEDEDA